MRTRRRHPARTLVAVIVGAAMTLSLGCVGQQTTDGDTGAGAGRPPLTEKVTLAELVPAERREAPLDPAAAEAARAGAEIAAHQLVVRRLLFRRNAPRLKLVTDTLDPPPIDAERLARWRANGFGVGEIELNRLPLLLANTPNSLGSSLARHSGPTAWVPLVTLEKVTGSHDVDYVDPAGRTRTVVQRSGHQQMLMRFERSAASGDASDGGVAGLRLSLLPHHYRRQLSLEPRTAEQKMLDGTPWFDLQLTEPIPTTRAWVIWANLPQPPVQPLPPPAPQRPETGDPDADADPDRAAHPDADADPDAHVDAPNESPAESSAPDHRPIPIPIIDPTEPTGPLTLAEAMLTGMRGNDPVQMVIVIYVEPPHIDPPYAAPSPEAPR